MPLLFSYGTLQLPQVQKDIFGRLVEGEADELLGFAKNMLEITDPAVLVSSGAQFHPVVRRSDTFSEPIAGTVFDVTGDELEKADSYEVSDYKREIVNLASGRSAWLYVKS